MVQYFGPRPDAVLVFAIGLVAFVKRSTLGPKGPMLCGSSLHASSISSMIDVRAQGPDVVLVFVSALVASSLVDSVNGRR